MAFIVRNGELTREGEAVLRRSRLLEQLPPGEYSLEELVLTAEAFQGKKDRNPRTHVLTEEVVAGKTVICK